MTQVLTPGNQMTEHEHRRNILDFMLSEIHEYERSVDTSESADLQVNPDAEPNQMINVDAGCFERIKLGTPVGSWRSTGAVDQKFW